MVASQHLVILDDEALAMLIACGRALECTDAEVVAKLAIKRLMGEINTQTAIKANKKFSEVAEDWMLHPSDFEGSNAVFGPPAGAREGEVHSLCAASVQWGDTQCVLSCWKPTREQLTAIGETGRVWLTVFGAAMPPVCLTSQNPLEAEGIDLR